MNLTVAYCFPNLACARISEARRQQRLLLCLSEREQVIGVNVVGGGIPFWRRWKFHGVRSGLTTKVSDAGERARDVQRQPRPPRAPRHSLDRLVMQEQDHIIVPVGSHDWRKYCRRARRARSSKTESPPAGGNLRLDCAASKHVCITTEMSDCAPTQTSELANTVTGRSSLHRFVERSRCAELMGRV